jgi:hypothetical protein
MTGPTRTSRPTGRTGQSRLDLVRVLVVTAARAAFVVLVGGAALPVSGATASAPARARPGRAAPGVVAACVMASRSPVERLADRVAYGPDGDPYSTLSSFAARISETVAVDDVLPRVAQTVTQATHSPSEVRLWLSDGGELREGWPNVDAAPAGGATVDVPVQRRGEQVGVLGVATDARAMTANTRAVLDRLAGAAGLALANVRLAHDLRHRIAESRDLADRLQMSRQRLVDAAAEQARRFSYLVDARVVNRLDAVGGALERARDGDASALEVAAEEAMSALEALRDIAAGVFPPTLADNGLRVALETLAMRHDGRVRVAHHGPDVRTANLVETAAYFCAALVVEDRLSAGGTVTVDIDQQEHGLRLRLTSTGAPAPGTVQLVEDRVEATRGVLDRRTDAAGVDGDHELVLDWQVDAP